MTAEGDELQAILKSIQRLATEVEQAQPGAPELAVVVAEVGELQRRLERVRSVMGPLVPDASRELDLDEKAAANLERDLSSLRLAAEARQSVG